MTIASLRELNKLMTLCKKQGIQSITVDGISFTIDYSLPQNTKHVAKGKLIQDLGINTPDMLTDEQLMYYSAGGIQSESFVSPAWELMEKTKNSKIKAKTA